MKAWILEKQAKIGKKPLKLTEVPTPHAEKGEIRIKNLVCGVCRTDIHIIEGDLPLKKSPVILGHEIVGVVDEVGKGVKRFKVGDKVGVCWLYSTCGKCKYCLSGRENFCPDIKCTGWDKDGGYAEYITIREDFALALNNVHLEPYDIAPLMCPGIAGYAAFKLTEAKKGDKLGLYGFGPTAFFVLKVAKSLGIEVYVSTRSEKNIKAANDAGAVFAADTSKHKMPCKLDSAIIFPPAGGLVEQGLSTLQRGGILVLAPVSATPIVIDDYSRNLWGRSIKTLYNLKRSDAQEFLEIANKLQIRPERCIFWFEDLPDVLISARKGELKEANAVIKISD
ncbi:MAG: alcohol dehydrogenase catalytic domain-containing protein [Deltaproteobacteria bacterium]|nr:alcohol dehydrogenase catalytic domain-containing protein [Deltaproteobacteria bacterium]